MKSKCCYYFFNFTITTYRCNGRYNFVILSKSTLILRDNEHLYKHYGYLQGMEVHQIMYAMQASNKVATMKYCRRVIRGTMLLCSYQLDGKLYIGTNEDCTALGLCDVEFHINHNYFDDLSKGVSKITDKVLQRILPTPDHFKCQLELKHLPRSRYPVLDIDEEQHPALQVIVNSQCSAPVLIPGVFGCGKTRILAVATECFVNQCKATGLPCRVLICCHHQHSADVFMNMYFTKMKNHKKFPWPVEIVRITSNNNYRSSHKYCTTVSDFQQCFFDDYRKSHYIVIVTTFGGALRISDVVPTDFFTHVLIDEGAQTREPEALSPLLMVNQNTRIVIAGDHHQVLIYYFV